MTEIRIGGRLYIEGPSWLDTDYVFSEPKESPMPILSATTPRQQELLRRFAGKLSKHLQEESKEVTAEVDYGMLAVPLIGMAVQVLQQRGLTREEIEAMILLTADQQFSQVVTPLLTLVK